MPPVELRLKHKALGEKTVVLYNGSFQVNALTPTEIVWSQVEARIKAGFRFAGTSQVKIEDERGRKISDSEALIAALVAHAEAKPERLGAYVEGLATELGQSLKKVTEGLTIQKAARTVWELASSPTHQRHVGRNDVLTGLVKACGASSFLGSATAAAAIEFILCKTSDPLREMMLGAGAVAGLLKQLSNSKIPRKDDERHRLHAAAAICRELRKSGSAKDMLLRLESKTSMGPDKVAAIITNACFGMNAEVVSACCASLTYILPHCTSEYIISAGTSLVYVDHPDVYKIGLWSLCAATGASQKTIANVLKPKSIMLSKDKTIVHSAEKLLDRLMHLGETITGARNSETALVRYIATAMWTFSVAISRDSSQAKGSKSAFRDIELATAMVASNSGNGGSTSPTKSSSADHPPPSLGKSVEQGLRMLQSLARFEDEQVARSASAALAHLAACGALKPSEELCVSLLKKVVSPGISSNVTECLAAAVAFMCRQRTLSGNGSQAKAFHDELGHSDRVVSLLILGLRTRVERKIELPQQYFLAASIMLLSGPHKRQTAAEELYRDSAPVRSLDTLTSMVSLLSSWELMEFHTKEYIGASLWSMSQNSENCKLLNKVAIVKHLLTLYALERPEGDTDPKGGGSENQDNADEDGKQQAETALQMKFKQLMAVRKAAARAKALLADSRLHKTRQYLMGAIYLILQEPTCQESLFHDESTLQSLIKGLNEPNRKVCATVVGIMWKLAETEVYASELIDRTRVVTLLLGVAVFGKRFSTTTRIFALHAVELLTHGRDELMDRVRRSSSICEEPWGGEVYFERALIHLLKVENLDLNHVASLSVSRLAMSSRQRALLKNGAIPALFEVVKRAVFDSHAKPGSDGRRKVSAAQMKAVEAATMALRNLSVYKPHQRVIAKQGLRVLMQLGIAIDDAKVSSNTKSILHNISLHPKNRTTLYRAQLKSEQAKHRYKAEIEIRRVLKIKSRSKPVRRRIEDTGAGDLSNSIAGSRKATRNETHWDLRRRQEAEKSWISVPQSAAHMIGYEDRLMFKKQSSLSQLLMRPISKMFDSQSPSKETRQNQRVAKSGRSSSTPHLFSSREHESLWEPRIVKYVFEDQNAIGPGVDTSHATYTKSRPATAAVELSSAHNGLRQRFKAYGRDDRHTQSLMRSKFMRPSTADIILSPVRATTASSESVRRKTARKRPGTSVDRTRTAPAKLRHLAYNKGAEKNESEIMNSAPDMVAPSSPSSSITSSPNSSGSNISAGTERSQIPSRFVPSTSKAPASQNPSRSHNSAFHVHLEPEHAHYNRLRFGVRRRPDYSRMTSLSEHPDVTLVRWKYVKGNRISENNYNFFELPDGRLSHFYSKAQLKQAVLPSVPPRSPLPFTLSQICPGFHEAVDEPLPKMGDPPRANKNVDAVSVCEESKMSFGFKEPPSGAIKFQDSLLLLFVEEKKPEIEAKRVVKKKKWSLPDSVFAPRAMKSDAKAFYDNDRVKKKAFKIDFSNLTAKKRFVNMVLKTDDDGGEEEMKEVRQVLWSCYSTIMDAFEFYSVMGTSVTQAYSIGLNAFSDFVDDCKIVDKATCSRKDIDTIFIVANLEEDKQSKTNKANDDRALMRFEFLDCVVRIAIAKYLKSGVTDDVSDALKMLCEQNIQKNLGPEALHDSNDFRRERMYFEDVDKVYYKHMKKLKMIFDVFAAPKVGFSTQSLMTLEEWCKFMKVLDLFDEDFTQREAKLAFAWSQMAVADEVRRRIPFTCITFEDFMEALARVCDMKALPTDKDLNGSSVAEWFKEKLNKGLLDDYCRDNPCNFFDKKYRPISDLLPKFLDLVYWKLDRDGDGDFDKADLQRFASRG